MMIRTTGCRQMLTLLALATVWTLHGVPAAAEEPSSFDVDLVVLTVPAEPGAPMEVVSDGAGVLVTQRPAQETAIYAGVDSVRFGGLALYLEGEALLWNGRPDPPPASGVEWLIDRRISVFAGQPTKIRAIVEDFHYFVPRENGLFEMKTLDRKDLPGLLLSCKVHKYRRASGAAPGSSAPLVSVDYNLRLVVVEGRDDIPGAPDNIGRPHLARFRLNRSEDLPLSAWHLISGHLISESGTNRGSYLLILIRVTAKE